MLKTSVKYYDDYWKIGEGFFNAEWLAKYETIFAQGNGYMGIRATTEENYTNETRNTFVAGTFNKFDENEVTELPNVPDMIQIQLSVNGELLNLNVGTVENYERNLNLKTGELVREFIWTTPKAEKIQFSFSRFVSFNQKHLFGQKVSITPLDKDTHIEVFSGIDGQQTNSGSQHFSEGKKRLYNDHFLRMISRTIESEIDFVLTTKHSFSKNDEEVSPESRIDMPRRSIGSYYWVDVKKNETLTIEKISNIHTSRDKEYIHEDLDYISTEALKELTKASYKGYDQLLEESTQAWNDKVWEIAPIHIESSELKDLLALNFAKYHLHVSVPAHDNRMNIAAKGLTGEGYKGHTFWDTEIFILPYFIYTHPEIAKSLEEYRYNSLGGARQKAKDNGFSGAQYPWESAWIDDGETTPVWGAADVITGEPTPIWTGIEEHHITSDVAFGVEHYYSATGDHDFMEKQGYEIILETAKFWTTRVELDEENDRYVITSVIGPDEYKEHVDNNAFTNHMAAWNLEKALEVINELSENQTDLYEQLDTKLDLATLRGDINDTLEKLYLPQPNEEKIIPQDDTYLSKEIIDLTKYKNQEYVGGLFHEYNMEQVNEMQITKQADVVLLLYLLEDKFTEEVKKTNFDYYEPKTMHDSSLSLASHAVMAADLGEINLSYELFRRATEIDMGPAMDSSDEGIHAASLGGIWQSVVMGYGGIRNLEGNLRINPVLPEAWSKLSYSIFWKNDELFVEVAEDKMTVTNKTKNDVITFTSFGQEYMVKENSVTINLGNKKYVGGKL